MPVSPQPRVRHGCRDRLRVQSVIALKCLFILSVLFSLAACIPTAATTNTSELRALKPAATPKAADRVSLSTSMADNEAPAAAADAPAPAAASIPATPVQAPLAAPPVALQVQAAVVPDPVAVPGQTAVSARLPVIIEASPAGLRDISAEEGGLINQSVCTQGLRGSLVTAQAGGNFLSANGASPSLDDGAPAAVAVRPATPLVDLAPSAGANEPSVSLTALSRKADLTRSLLMAAYEQTGRPYVAGGQSPAAGFDAAGYVRWVYGQEGINLPREPQKQAGAGRQVTKDDLRPGDMLLYRDPDSRGEAYHVGIYTGQGNFLHATAKTGVVNETAAFGPQYAPYFMGGRRYFDDPDAAPLSDAQKMAAASSAVKLALSELGPDDKLVRPTVGKPRAAAKKSRGKARSGGKSKKK